MLGDWVARWMLILYGQRPNELMVKRVAMVGCSALVLAHSVKDSKKLSSYAGRELPSPTSDRLHFCRWTAADYMQRGIARE